MNKKFLNMMMEIQKRQGWPYRLIMFVNELYIRFFLPRRVAQAQGYRELLKVNGGEFVIKVLDISDASMICDFFKYSIKTDNADYVMPHKTDPVSIAALFRKISHIPLGIFHDNDLVGYALIRLLFPNSASYAIFIAEKWRGRGIGTIALKKQIDLIKHLKFQPHSAVCKKNERSLNMLKKLGIEHTGDLGDYYEVKDRARERI